jgi:hypothetical protein
MRTDVIGNTHNPIMSWQEKTRFCIQGKPSTAYNRFKITKKAVSHGMKHDWKGTAVIAIGDEIQADQFMMLVAS